MITQPAQAPVSAAGMRGRRMKRAGSVLILSLWTLVVLGVLALAVGGYVSASTRSARFMLDDVAALSLAQAGVRMAISEIMITPSNFDISATGDLPNHEDRFRENATIPGGNFSVYYLFDDTNAASQGIITNYGVIRERMKINIDRGISAGTDRLERVLGWLGADASLVMGILSNYPGRKYGATEKTVAPDYLTRYGPYEALPELLAVPDVNGPLFEGLEPLVTIHEFDRFFLNEGKDRYARQSYGGIAEGHVLRTGGATAAMRRVTFVFDRVTTNLLYWREH